mmetsp:Transcript_11277/g.39292  ORF Transcript_11277/g.39292 Transcript_11277/m.39292 type:complete len:188 (-) Transcript_11277:230-793(-)|eukprot:CAMPEP_0203810336 /NCGR_PEP_ID=MMETSP0115-20131106/2885_1 /ASSEMBLY_ACC=CAM_ASM_000227 /TAXON_ID=33651 /ORGANISM="Bicosoecid sp, Strain ms1" /LENGTH=187 /DNA_ID=CAMNT_0050719127 /DNA_START=176 /DNA_END=739 /DNA_ORIENTATION=-
MAVVAGAAAAAVIASFSGTYLLNKERSDSIEPFLAAVGAPWIARKMAARAQPTTIIAVGGGSGGGDAATGGAGGGDDVPVMDLTQKSSFRTTTNSYRVGAGVVTVTTRGDGKEGRSLCEARDDGTIYLQTAEADEGSPVVTTVYSFLGGDRDRLTFRLRYHDNRAKFEAGDAKVDITRHADRVADTQ